MEEEDEEMDIQDKMPDFLQKIVNNQSISKNDELLFHPCEDEIT